jgi:hypothetical protein
MDGHEVAFFGSRAVAGREYFNLQFRFSHAVIFAGRIWRVNQSFEN